MHTLDGERHRARKELFVSLLKDHGRVAALARRAEDEWERARVDWQKREHVVLFDEMSQVLTPGVGAEGPEGRQDLVRDQER